MSRTITLSEVKKHKNDKSVWVIIHNDVYDLTKFLNEHPGGADSLLEVAGRDGTQGFEDVQHSQDAREMMMKYKIGTLPASERQKPIASCPKQNDCASCSITSRSPSKAPSEQEPSSPKPVRRVESIFIPATAATRESSGSGKLKWAVLALAAAIIIGISLKKYYAA